MAIQFSIQENLDMQSRRIFGEAHAWTGTDTDVAYAPGDIVLGSDNELYVWSGAATVANSDPVGGTAGMPWTVIATRDHIVQTTDGDSTTDVVSQVAIRDTLADKQDRITEVAEFRAYLGDGSIPPDQQINVTYDGNNPASNTFTVNFPDIVTSLAQIPIEDEDMYEFITPIFTVRFTGDPSYVQEVPALRNPNAWRVPVSALTVVSGAIPSSVGSQMATIARNVSTGQEVREILGEIANARITGTRTLTLERAGNHAPITVDLPESGSGAGTWDELTGKPFESVNTSQANFATRAAGFGGLSVSDGALEVDTDGIPLEAWGNVEGIYGQRNTSRSATGGPFSGSVLTYNEEGNHPLGGTWRHEELAVTSLRDVDVTEADTNNPAAQEGQILRSYLEPGGDIQFSMENFNAPRWISGKQYNNGDLVSFHNDAEDITKVYIAEQNIAAGNANSPDAVVQTETYAASYTDAANMAQPSIRSRNGLLPTDTFLRFYAAGSNDFPTVFEQDTTYTFAWLYTLSGVEQSVASVSVLGRDIPAPTTDAGESVPFIELHFNGGAEVTRNASAITYRADVQANTQITDAGVQLFWTPIDIPWREVGALDREDIVTIRAESASVTAEIIERENIPSVVDGPNVVSGSTVPLTAGLNISGMRESDDNAPSYSGAFNISTEDNTPSTGTVRIDLNEVTTDTLESAFNVPAGTIADPDFTSVDLANPQPFRMVYPGASTSNDIDAIPTLTVNRIEVEDSSTDATVIPDEFRVNRDNSAAFVSEREVLERRVASDRHILLAQRADGANSASGVHGERLYMASYREAAAIQQRRAEDYGVDGNFFLADEGFSPNQNTPIDFSSVWFILEGADNADNTRNSASRITSPLNAILGSTGLDGTVNNPTGTVRIWPPVGEQLDPQRRLTVNNNVQDSGSHNPGFLQQYQFRVANPLNQNDIPGTSNGDDILNSTATETDLQDMIADLTRGLDANFGNVKAIVFQREGYDIRNNNVYPSCHRATIGLDPWVASATNAEYTPVTVTSRFIQYLMGGNNNTTPGLNVSFTLSGSNRSTVLNTGTEFVVTGSTSGGDAVSFTARLLSPVTISTTDANTNVGTAFLPGGPDHPTTGRLWEIVDGSGVLPATSASEYQFTAINTLIHPSLRTFLQRIDFGAVGIGAIPDAGSGRNLDTAFQFNEVYAGSPSRRIWPTDSNFNTGTDTYTNRLLVRAIASNETRPAFDGSTITNAATYRLEGLGWTNVQTDSQVNTLVSDLSTAIANLPDDIDGVQFVLVQPRTQAEPTDDQGATGHIGQPSNRYRTYRAVTPGMPMVKQFLHAIGDLNQTFVEYLNDSANQPPVVSMDTRRGVPVTTLSSMISLGREENTSIMVTPDGHQFFMGVEGSSGTNGGARGGTAVGGAPFIRNSTDLSAIFGEPRVGIGSINPDPTVPVVYDPIEDIASPTDVFDEDRYKIRYPNLYDGQLAFFRTNPAVIPAGFLLAADPGTGEATSSINGRLFLRQFDYFTTVDPGYATSTGTYNGQTYSSQVRIAFNNMATEVNAALNLGDTFTLSFNGIPRTFVVTYIRPSDTANPDLQGVVGVYPDLPYGNGLWRPTSAMGSAFTDLAGVTIPLGARHEQPWRDVLANGDASSTGLKIFDAEDTADRIGWNNT